jgi:acetyl CoA:N6-hydroxylysine acetyl transferase
MTNLLYESEFFIIEEGHAHNFLFRPVDLDKDLTMLYEWMHSPHIAPFWKLDLPMAEFKEWLSSSIESKHKDIYIGYYNGKPVSYLIAYSVKNDPIREHYDAKDGDLGMHLLIGPRPFLNKQDGLSLIRSMVVFLFHQYGAKRIIGEPDIRNRIIIPLLRELGGDVLGQIELSNKKASLIMGERKKIEAKLKEMNVTVAMLKTISKLENTLL